VRVQRDAWRAAVRSVVTSLTYPEHTSRLRRVSAFAAVPGGAPRCITQIGSRVWLGCGGVRVALFDAAQGTSLLSFRLAVPPALQLAAVRAFGDDALDVSADESEGACALPIAALAADERTLVLALGEQLLSVALADCSDGALAALVPQRSASPTRAASPTPTRGS
jgi:hypothetical protein